MKKHFLTTFLLLLFVLTLAACMPAGYTKDKVDRVTKEHAHEATDWFRSNIPDAKVKSAEAFRDGTDLFAAISGEYSLKGETYKYIYDYYNSEMYLEYEYRQAEETAQKMIDDYFGTDINGAELFAAKYSFETFCENDKGGQYPNSAEYGAIISTNSLEILPAGSDPEEYAKRMLEEGMGDSCYVKVSCDTLPEYDPAFFERFGGITSVYYSVVADLEYDDIYRVWYMPDKATYYHLKITKFKDDLYGGYYYEIIDTYDENGELIEHTDDSDDYDPATLYTENGDGSFTLSIPPGHAQMILLGRKGKYYTVRHSSTGPDSKSELYDWSKSPFEYRSGYERFMDDIVLPKSKLTMYMRINANHSDDGKYEIVVE